MSSDPPIEKQSSHETADAKGSAVSYAADPSKLDGKFHVVDEQQIEAVVERIVMRTEAFSGPTPHPEHLERYEKTYPGASKLIFEQYVANLEHSRSMDRSFVDLQNKKLDAEVKRDHRSQRSAFWLVGGGLLVVLACAYLKATTIGCVVAGTLLVTVLRSFLLGKHHAEKDAEGGAGSSDKEKPGDKDSPDREKSGDKQQEEDAADSESKSN
ncbi:DUF2335 domain-containing protein [Paraburkholderia bryophila]|uniref:Putative membrane protein n=1 Tax=Paraburkholderia bryophila TaxID=420952 RepID=A0A329CMC8_9BURK|nr:DUF2335 domain-containing protein [Paraburkholderia bryophila]RAS35879.1 putative membrane protein [Paraburkholderia bryophila]